MRDPIDDMQILLSADLADARSLLAAAPEDDVIGRASMTARVEAIELEIAMLDEAAEDNARAASPPAFVGTVAELAAFVEGKS